MPNKRGKTILVTGATGHQGGAALRALRKKNFLVRPLTRDPSNPKARALVGQGTEVVRGDLDDDASLTRALDGVDGMYSVQAWENGLETEVRQGIKAADAAKRSRISQFVYSSVASADQGTGIPHFESKNSIEQHVRATGIPFTILRPVFFMDNWINMRGMVDRGAIQLPLSPDTRLQMIAAQDIGAFVALAFERPGKWKNRTFEIAGDELSMTDLAGVFSRVSGQEVRYEQIPWEQFEQNAGHEMTAMYRYFESPGYHVDIASVRAENPELTTFERWLRASWTAAPATLTGRP